MATTRDILGVIVSISVLSAMIVMMFTFLFHEYNYKKNGLAFWKLRLDKIITILLFSCFTIFALHTTINSIYSIVSSNNNNFNYNWCLAHSLEMISFSFGKLLLYQFFIVRLYQVFGDTPFVVSKLKLKIIATIISIPIFFTSLVGIVNAIQIHNQEIKSDIIGSISNANDCTKYTRSLRTSVQVIMLYIGVTMYVLNEIIYSIFVLRTFVGRILLLSMPVWQQEKGNSTTMFSQELLDLAIRTTNLVILSVCSQLILLIKFGARLDVYWLNLEALFSGLSIYLTFKFSTPFYNCLFKPCHKVLFRPCIWFCFCCCLSIKLPQEMDFKYNKDNDKNNPQKRNAMDNDNAFSVDMDNIQQSIDSINEFQIT
eukprot:454278_1